MKNNAKILMLPFLMMGLFMMLTNSCSLFEEDDTDPVLKDYNGNVYETVTIGEQVWMAENLRTTHLDDGTAIPLVSAGTAWGELTTPGYCWYGNDKNTNGEIYGALYNWYAVDTDKLCPAGWHIPTDAEWTKLTDHLGGDTIAGGKLKEAGTEHWKIPNTGATNETDFTALPGGYRDTAGVYVNIENNGSWWTSTVISGVSANNRSMSFADKAVKSPDAFMKDGFAIRCIKD